MTQLAFLLGAGASYPFGIPMMREFYTGFVKYVDTHRPHCSPFLRSITDEWPKTADLETLLTTLEDLIALARTISLVGGPTEEQKTRISLAAELKGYLDSFLIETCERFDPDLVGRRLLGIVRLASISPFWIFTTNYDRLIETACKASAINYCDGFEAQSTKPVAAWNGQFDGPLNLVKLHGSVNWYQEDGGTFRRLERGYSLPSSEFWLTRDSQRLRPLMIVPTQEKAALRPPYAELGVRFSDVLKDTGLLVVIGNSLRDSHIRNYIQTRLSTLNVLIVSPNASSLAASLGSPSRTHAINSGFLEFLDLGVPGLETLIPKLLRLPPGDSEIATLVAGFVENTQKEINAFVADTVPAEVQPLLRHLVNGDLSERVRAARELGKHNHPKVLRTIQDVLTTADSSAVRVSLVDSLWQLEGPNCVSAILKLLEQEKNDDVRIEALLALRKASTSAPAAADYLQTVLAASATPPIIRQLLTA